MEAATASPTNPLARSEFRNDSGGQCGVIVIENGREKAISVKPGDTILLSAQEQILTANAPKSDKDNPFTNGTLTLITPAANIANRRAIGDPSMVTGESKTPVADPKAAEEERLRREALARQKAEAEAKRTAEAQKQAERGAQPRKAPSTKTEGEGAAPKPQPEETANKPQPAGDVEGERAAEEETG